MKKGELIIIPTDTVYGLCAKLYDNEGLDNIFKLKERDFNKKIPILVSNYNQIKDIAVVSDEAKNIMETFWPGALTIVLKTTPEFYNKTKEETIALRMPNHKLALKVINDLGPLRATSVNKSNEKPLLSYDEIIKKYSKSVSKIYKQEEEQLNISSTVIDMSSNYQLLREGAISNIEILKILKPQ